MENVLKIAPLALLLIGVVWVVFRGLGGKADGSKNKENIGGGPGSGSSTGGD